MLQLGVYMLLKHLGLIIYKKFSKVLESKSSKSQQSCQLVFIDGLNRSFHYAVILTISLDRDLQINILNIYLFKRLVLLESRSGFPKVGQVALLGAMTDTQGATSSKGVRGGP